MGSAASRQEKKERKEAKRKAEQQRQEEAEEFCTCLSRYMTGKGFPNFKKLTDSQREAITKIYKGLIGHNVSTIIRKAIEKGCSSIKLLAYSQEGDYYQKKFDHIGTLQDHEYRLIVSYILKQKFPFLSKMKLDFCSETTNESRPLDGWDDDEYTVCWNYVTISWSKIKIKKQDIMRCREYTTGALRWNMCKTTLDMIVYERLVQFRRKTLKDNAIAACQELGASTKEIKTPGWDGTIPEFVGDDTDFKNLGCQNGSDNSEE